ncbi:MAG: hypothetical protein ACT4OK_16370 [Gemmobacter sp.]
MSLRQTFVIPDYSADIQRLRQDLEEVKALLQKAVITPRPEWPNVPDYAAYIGKTVRTENRMIAEGRVEVKHFGGVRMIRV